MSWKIQLHPCPALIHLTFGKLESWGKAVEIIQTLFFYSRSLFLQLAIQLNHCLHLKHGKETKSSCMWSLGKCIQRRIYKEFKSINILVKVNHLKELTYIWSAGCPLWTIEQLNPLPRAKSSTLLFCQCHGQIGATVKSCDLGQIFT